jgi:hypothetical protein
VQEEDEFPSFSEDLKTRELVLVVAKKPLQ